MSASLEDLLHPLLKAYVGSPQWLKSSVGRAYSLLPARARQGAAYARFAAEAAERDPGSIMVMACAKLAQTLRWAADTVPYYRRLRLRLAADATAQDWLRGFPVVGKEDIKRDTASFLSDAIAPRARLPMFTGGSTANPMAFFLHRGVSRPKEAAYADAFDRRAGIGARDVILNLRGRSVATAAGSGGRTWMYEPIRRHLILSSDHLEARHMPEYVRTLRQWRPGFIQAFPSALYPLARWLAANPAPEVTAAVRCIQLTSENVYDFQSALLREVFGCPVLRHYGHSERVLMATSLADDERYLFWPLYGHLELVDCAGEPVKRAGVVGEVVGTSFDNLAMPFVRYRTGDLAVWSERGHPDHPGWPVCERIEGRLQEFVVCRDHRLVSITTLGAAHFSELARVEAIQFEQHVAGEVVLKLQSTAPVDEAMKAAIARAVRDKTQHGCDVEVIRVERIERTARGKLRMIEQHLDLSGYLGASAHD